VLIIVAGLVSSDGSWEWGIPPGLVIGVFLALPAICLPMIHAVIGVSLAIGRSIRDRPRGMKGAAPRGIT
jgi:uncharacterized protein YqgC (DUF456 family)